MKNFKHSRFLLFSLFFACLILLALSFYLIQHRPFDSRILPVRFMIGDKIGIEINDSALTFGRAVPGTSLHRGVFVTIHMHFPLLCVFLLIRLLRLMSLLKMRHLLFHLARVTKFRSF